MLVPFLFISCTKTTEINGSVSIVGLIKLIDENGKDNNHRSGVLVNLKDKDISVYTNENGLFLLSSLSPGVSYKLSYSKEGYGSLSNATGKYIGDQKPGYMGTITLFQIPLVELQNPSIGYSNDFVTITGDLANSDNVCKYQVYVNDSANVSEVHYDYSVSGLTWLGSTFFETRVTLNDHKYASGTKIFVAVYFVNSSDYGYRDIESNRNVYSSGKRVAYLSKTITY